MVFDYFFSLTKTSNFIGRLNDLTQFFDNLVVVYVVSATLHIA